MILGDMFELGAESTKEHQEIVDSLLTEKELVCFFIGSAFYGCKLSHSKFQFYESFESFSDYLKEKSIENSTILIKGSRGMALERLLDYLLLN
jgi:UDP-N-acetylmuramoyl-tripeptide--D-alanyl-D-alanine ligase